MSAPIKLSSPATRQFWEIPVLYEDEALLALDKPAQLLTSPDRNDPQRPNLMRLLHAGIAAGKPWARERGLGYLANAHRLDFETTGVLVLAKTKPVLIALANQFGSEKPAMGYLALAHGSPAQATFEVDARIAPVAAHPGLMRASGKTGKKSCTRFEVLERFASCTLLRCRPLTNRTHQVRVHLRHAGHPIVGDRLYGGHPLLLSSLKREYRLKAGRTERPLLDSVALHAESLEIRHPVTDEVVRIVAPWPKHLRVAVKFLRQYAAGGRASAP
jgi:RluA family pseudouridine synthase